jgi:hypothetical protein
VTVSEELPTRIILGLLDGAAESMGTGSAESRRKIVSSKLSPASAGRFANHRLVTMVTAGGPGLWLNECGIATPLGTSDRGKRLSRVVTKMFM